MYRLLFLFTASRPRLQEDQRDIKRLQQELRRKDKALAEAAALLLASKKIQAYWGEGGDD